MQKDNITRPSKGLHLDSSIQEQPKDTYKYALNSVAETELGDFAFISNEESNIEHALLPKDYILIGNTYMQDNEEILFLVKKDESASEIGILKGGIYTTIVNDETSVVKDKLHFKISKQIDSTYRLRKGCERTVYWIDDENKPRYFNLDKTQNFKNHDGTWASNKFNLQKTYEKIPNFEKVEVVNSGGVLEPGGYNISVQYLDEDLNPTEHITTSPTVKIYNDLPDKQYREINGSINSDVDYINFPETGKAISIVLSNLDTSYLYYRLAIIESSNGSGQVNKISLTEVIPTSKNFFIYTGKNATSTTREEILKFTDVIERAAHIEQIENRLLIANTQGKQIDFCKLQKYASRVKADCVTKKIVLNDIKDISNQKNPSHEFYGVGYMPGEIYSFGLVYIFEDGTISPVYHIPGKNNNIDKTTVFSPGLNVYPMNNTNNKNKNTTYIDNETCGNSSYWGLDSEGQPLLGKHIRHHRFPLRTEINKPLVVDSNLTEQPIEQKYYCLQLNIKGNLKVPYECPDNTPDCPGKLEANNFEVRVTYTENGQNFIFSQEVDANQYSNNENTFYALDLLQVSNNHSSNNLTVVNIQITNKNGNFVELTDPIVQQYFINTPSITTEIIENTSFVQNRIFTTDILGIKFSGIEAPSLEDTNGLKIVGYYIVRNERTEFDRTVIDNGIITPCLTNNKYISHGLLQPELNDKNRLSKNIFGFIHPEHKFNQKELTNYDKIIQQGYFETIETKKGKVNYDDVYDGSSYNSKRQKGGNDDGHSVDGLPDSRGYDGWSFNLISRDNIVSFKQANNFEIKSTDFKSRFYLDALGSKSILDSTKDVYNLASDNKIGILELNTDKEELNQKLHYVTVYKENIDPYSNFRILPYYKENINPEYFNENKAFYECSVFNGDSYIAPIRYVNTMFYNNRIARRAGRTSALKIVLGAVVAAIGILLVAISSGLSSSLIVAGAGIAIAGAGASFLSSGIKQDNFNKAYNEEYDKGLRLTTMDDWVDMFYNYKPNNTFGVTGNGGWGEDGPSDDTIQWIGESITDLWFESNININLRNKFSTDDTPTFIDAPGRIESGKNSPIGTWEYFGNNYQNSNSLRYPVSSLEKYLVKKLLVFDQKRDDNRFYLGIALGEYYNVNPDYMRKNVEKVFNHLALEYDCCSECKEDFPHRIHYSEQSYQEELTDNYRIFLPNNYRDIEGESGEITNIFRISNNLFIHTLEGIWKMPRNYQERITDQLVSFIGTGSYFEIPPQKIIDDDTGSSAGCQHKWSSIKTPNGYFFMCENQRTFYGFDGNKLSPISSEGMYNWFYNNSVIQADLKYYKDNFNKYKYRDNVSNPIGTGYITGYDAKKKRILLTKKDFILPTYDNKYELTIYNGKVKIFKDIQIIIDEYNKLGWHYVGIKEDYLLFEKTKISHKTEIRQINSTLIQKEIPYYKTEFLKVKGSEITDIHKINNSWTLSYSLKMGSWTSWHSYLPNYYIGTPANLFSWINEQNTNYLWEHNVTGNYQTYYNKYFPHILEYVSNSTPTVTRIWNSIKLLTESKKYNFNLKEFYEDLNTTFNKAVLYNGRQCSGEITLQPKDLQSSNYIEEQIINSNSNVSVIDRREEDWLINDFRDIRINYNVPIWNSDIYSLQDEYYIDKKLNTSSLDIYKDWTQLESFRDKYLVIRLIFDKFANVKLITNYSVENEQESFR